MNFEKGTKEGKLNIVTGMEGLSQIGEDIDMINYFYNEVGVRHAMLTWNELKRIGNRMAGGCNKGTYRSRKESRKADSGSWNGDGCITSK